MTVLDDEIKSDAEAIAYVEEWAGWDRVSHFQTAHHEVYCAWLDGFIFNACCGVAPVGAVWRRADFPGVELASRILVIAAAADWLEEDESYDLLVKHEPALYFHSQNVYYQKNPYPLGYPEAIDELTASASHLPVREVLARLGADQERYPRGACRLGGRH